MADEQPTPRIDGLAAGGMRPLNFNVGMQCTPRAEMGVRT